MSKLNMYAIAVSRGHIQESMGDIPSHLQAPQAASFFPKVVNTFLWVVVQ